MRVAVIGGRDFDNYDFMKQVLDEYQITHIVSGGARGADRLAELYAKNNLLPITIYKPDWSVGIHAGFLRNKSIVNDCDMIIAFWDGMSAGTKSSITYAKKCNKQVIIIRYKNVGE